MFAGSITQRLRNRRDPSSGELKREQEIVPLLDLIDRMHTHRAPLARLARGKTASKNRID